MKKALSAVAVALLVVGIGYKVSQDPDVQRLITPPTNTRVSTSNTLVPPTFVRDYAEAFCRADAATVAAGTDIEGVTEEDIATYFASGPACLGVRYLGQLTDSGVRRYIFVFDFEEGRTDWVVFTFNDADKLANFKRG